ncbi:hypothetical protein OROGR_006217 [Orobanche gracilis]
MSRFPEISSLFAALASNLQAPNPTAENELDMSLANLNRSLNLSGAPRVRILDTTLSLMCFTAPQVYDSVIEFTVRTIITVLSSSIQCKVLRIKKEQVFIVGGLIWKSDCVNFMNLMIKSANILRKLDGHKGDLCTLLLYNIIRVAALARNFPLAIPSASNENTNSDSNTSALANLVSGLQNEFSFANGIPLRLLLWQLDPMILKQDVSQILREIIKRPFLSLSTEIYDRTEWKSKMICLVLSPSMFIETRAFLHNWFLMTSFDLHNRGLASIMELQSEFVRKVLDIISRPMCWGISMEVGSKLPFSHAYFPYEHSLLRILAGPISYRYLQHLLCKISYSDSQAEGRRTTRKVKAVDHKSSWATVMNFPGWFFFASMLLFSNNNPKDKPCLMQESEAIYPAKFISWILNPMAMSQSNQCLAVDCLVKVSSSWAMKCSSSNKHNNEVTRNHKESRRRFKLRHEDGGTTCNLDYQAVLLWLKEFQDMYAKISRTKIGLSIPDSKGLGIGQNLLFRRIPLGILLMCPHHLSATGCSLILHYAATGTIQKSRNMQYSVTIEKRGNYDFERDSLMWIELYTKADATAGCKTVFDLTDIAMSISHSMFGTEEEGLEFVCRLKSKTCDYLLKCVERLLRINVDRNADQIESDLLTRIIKWRHQGNHVCRNNEDLDRLCDALKCKSSVVR